MFAGIVKIGSEEDYSKLWDVVSEDLVKVSGGYLGSMVLRPTEVTPLGRTLLSPSAIAGFQGFVAEVSSGIPVVGAAMKVQSAVYADLRRL